MKKKLVSVLLTAAMVASLVGCGGGSAATTEEAPAEKTETKIKPSKPKSAHFSSAAEQ